MKGILPRRRASESDYESDKMDTVQELGEENLDLNIFSECFFVAIFWVLSKNGHPLQKNRAFSIH